MLMLNIYNEKLNALREEMAQKGKLEAVRRELTAQRDELAQRVGELSRELSQEQEDVDRLTGGFWSIYYSIIGRKADMLETERAEVLKASMKYETAKQELERVQAELDRIDWEIGSLKRREWEYQEILKQKIEAMKAQGIDAEKLNGLEEKKQYLAHQIREVNEAMAAGRQVLGQIDAIGGSLDHAEDWGTWDVLGGGLIADIAKHSHLDDAQKGVQALERRLLTFRTELADVTIQADIQVQVDGFLRFADWFFDGLFVDWTVLSHIRESKESLEKTERQVRRVMDQLRQMEREMKRREERLDREIRALAEAAE